MPLGVNMGEVAEGKSGTGSETKQNRLPLGGAGPKQAQSRHERLIAVQAERAKELYLRQQRKHRDFIWVLYLSMWTGAHS